MQAFRIEFEDEDKFSLNKIWSGGRGMQWIRKAMADNWHHHTEKALEEFNIQPITDECILLFYFKFRKNMLDSSNVSPMAKAIEDTLTKEGILVSDTNADVKGVYYSSINLPKKERDEMRYNVVDVVVFEKGKDEMFDILNGFSNIIK